MHITSDRNLLACEQDQRDGVAVAADTLLRALQLEHPEIVRHLQDKAAANRKDQTHEH